MLQLAIAFCGVQVAAWVAMGLYIRAMRQRRAQAEIVNLVVDVEDQAIVARAA